MVSLSTIEETLTESPFGKKKKTNAHGTRKTNELSRSVHVSTPAQTTVHPYFGGRPGCVRGGIHPGFEPVAHDDFDKINPNRELKHEITHS
jgi:hypothetical protein